MTESTTPQLTESDVAQIEARLTRITGVEMANGRHPASWDEVAALIRDWRALHDALGLQQRTMRFWEESYLAEHETWGNCKWKAENAALREQLATAEKELEELRNFKQDMSGEFLGI